MMKVFGGTRYIVISAVFIHICNLNIIDATYFTALNVSMKHSPIKSVINKMLACSLTETFSLGERLRNTLDCLSPYIIHCMPTNNSFIPSRTAHYSYFPFCGIILILPISSIHSHLSLHVLKDHILQFDFLLFMFYRTFASCGPDDLHLVDQSINKSYVYCGSRMPWKLISTGNHCDIIMKVSRSFSSRMTLFYHVIYKPHVTSVMAVSDRLVMETSLKDVFAQYIQTVSFTLSVSPHQIIHLSVLWQENEGLDYIRVYDGPGHKSPLIMVLNRDIHDGTYETTTSAFSMYLLVSHTTHRSTIAIFDTKALNYKNTQICKTRSTRAMDMYDTVESFSLRSNDRRENFVCRYKSTSFSLLPYSSIYLEKLVFYGMDTLDSLDSEGCNYGGIFIRDASSSSIKIARCESLMHLSWHPNNTSSIELFVIWYAEYSHGRINGQIQYSYCSTIHLATDSSFSHLDETSSCQAYICFKTSCNVHFTKQNGSFGPGIFKTAVSSKLPLIYRHVHSIQGFPTECISEVNIWALNRIQWIYFKAIHERHIFRSNIDTFMESYSFLHNLSVSIDTCTHVPIRMLLLINQCMSTIYSQPTPQYKRTGFMLNLYRPCIADEFTRVTFYHTKPVDVAIVVSVKLKYIDCDSPCKNKTIIIHELIPDEGIVYQYNFSFTGHFKWHTHRKQGGFSFTVHPHNTTKCNFSCDIEVVTELMEETSDNNKLRVYDYKVFPMG